MYIHEIAEAIEYSGIRRKIWPPNLFLIESQDKRLEFVIMCNLMTDEYYPYNFTTSDLLADDWGEC